MSTIQKKINLLVVIFDFYKNIMRFIYLNIIIIDRFHLLFCNVKNVENARFFDEILKNEIDFDVEID